MNQHRRMFVLSKAPDLTLFGIGGYSAREGDFVSFVGSSEKTLAELESDFWNLFWMPALFFAVQRGAKLLIAHI